MSKILKIFLYITGIALGLFLFPFFLKVFAPFILAFAVAAPCQKFVGFFERRFNLSRGITSAILSVLIVATALLVVFFLATELYLQSKNLISALPAAIDSLSGSLSGIWTRFDGYRHSLPAFLSDAIDGAILGFKDSAKDLSSRMSFGAIDFAKNIASRLGNIFLFIAMFILGTFFFTKDYLLVMNFFKDVLPAKVLDIFKKGVQFLSRAFSSYIKAQLVLMLITSSLVTVCLWITGQKNPLLWGVVSGLIDSLPFFGTAIILLPWAVLSLIYGDLYSFVSLVLTWVIVFVARQLAEPKIVSHHIGIHPILTLVSIYVGLKFFGVAGVIFAPILVLLFVNFYVSYKEKADG